ncbi:hypothetical protein GIB67_013769 [Kingdonia uniflora]|uniref:Uncharacterized protein n=1 Tax=Kingdonia uniflora TaxID=39325 RepID=A0A7J7MMZ3_9MAGN|nr:hypothetical protein GIB67_013769 [Kingdonia uniflora]
MRTLLEIISSSTVQRYRSILLLRTAEDTPPPINRCRSLTVHEASVGATTLATDFDSVKDGELTVVANGAPKKIFWFDSVFSQQADQGTRKSFILEGSKDARGEFETDSLASGFLGRRFKDVDVNKAKQDMKSKDVFSKKMEETIHSLELKGKTNDLNYKNLQDKVKELES